MFELKRKMSFKPWSVNEVRPLNMRVVFVNSKEDDSYVAHPPSIHIDLEKWPK
jgi:hypothetical protein